MQSRNQTLRQTGILPGVESEDLADPRQDMEVKRSHLFVRWLSNVGEVFFQRSALASVSEDQSFFGLIRLPGPSNQSRPSDFNLTRRVSSHQLCKLKRGRSSSPPARSTSRKTI